MPAADSPGVEIDLPSAQLFVNSFSRVINDKVPRVSWDQLTDAYRVMMGGTQRAPLAA